MKQAEQRLHEILGLAEKLRVPPEGLVQLLGARKLLEKRRRSTGPVFAGVLSVTIAFIYALGLYTHNGFSRAWLKWHQQDLYGQMCTISMPDQLLKVFRPPEDCIMCQGLSHVDKLSKISPSQFEEIYAYSGRPVVVMDAMENWTAQHVFSFQYFKGIYEESFQTGCQFFPYETEFTHLRDVFNMSDERSSMRDGTKPWYIGWRNCDDRVARILRKHYGRPYFLPSTAESKKVDWIFMGSPGYGAHMHVDNVQHPSWQAQLRGHKKWTLEPPPECYYHCASLQVTVEPGEIIVLDTNRWYHQTQIVSDEMSITIGAEYD